MNKIDWQSPQTVSLISIVIIAITWLFWPIPTPIFQQVKDNTALSVYKNNSFQQEFTAPAHFIDGLDIQSQGADSLPGSTIIDLVISRKSDGVILEVQKKTLASILSSNKLRYRFLSVATKPNETLSITLLAPSLPEKKPLFVRYFSDTKQLSFSVFSPQPQIVSLIHQILATNTVGTDIALTYDEGGHILSGTDPYNRILQGNLQDNESYATYLPSFYLLSAASQWDGLHSYATWIQFWRPVFLLFALATAILLFTVFWQEGLYVLAFFAAAFFLFNRWSLYIATVGLFDFIPIFFLALSLVMFKRRPFVGLLLCGLSLSFRHIGAIILPLYFIALWQSSSSAQKIRRSFIGLGSLLVIPLAVSLPFMAANFASFVKSMLFSFTRAPVTHFNVPSVDAFLGLIGPSAKIGMLLLLVAIFYAYGRKYLGFFFAAFLAFVVFLDFHSVWFAQYTAYAAPLLMLAILEAVQLKKYGRKQ